MHPHHRTILSTLLLLASATTNTAIPAAAPAAATPVPQATNPQCELSSKPKYHPIPSTAAKELNEKLDALGDAPTFDNCATADDGSPNAIATTADGLYKVTLWSDGASFFLTNPKPVGKLAMGCARAANYLQGLGEVCGGPDGVSGCQFVTEVDGMQVCVGVSDGKGL